MMVQFDVKRVQKGTESFMVSFDFSKTPVTQVADYIIIAASNHKASDIHFDPREDGMMVRFRIDGDCQDYTFVPKAYEKNLTTRLKLLANMNITESRLPQDGAIKGDFGGTYLDMRVSSLPLNEGEKIVIRILDYTRSSEGIDSLGFHPENLKKIKRMMEIPNGIILTTGATGSGKSTTTYSILQGLNKPEKNIITVEDPIEMNIEGINQVQVNSEIGMTFAAALRSILRQDPNIILIGEIRDSETAQIAVRASITGHLVLSTIHTNNALATVERLLDMNVERYLLSTALTGIISQRLAKMLCPDCRFQRPTTPYEKKVFKRFMHRDVPMIWDANPKGCEHCRRGYHGRIAFHEVLELDDEIRSALNNEKLEKTELAKMVYTNKTITMLQDALIKCLEGKTSFEEVYRNIEIETEDDDTYESEIGDFLKEVTANLPSNNPDDWQESDELIDTKVDKNDKNNISNMMKGPVFSASDFNYSSDNKNISAETNGASVNVPPKKTVPAVNIPGVANTNAPIQSSNVVSNVNNNIQNKQIVQNDSQVKTNTNTSGVVASIPTAPVIRPPISPSTAGVPTTAPAMKSITTNPPIQAKPIIPTINTTPVQSTIPAKTQSTNPTILSIPTAKSTSPTVTSSTVTTTAPTATTPPTSKPYSNTNYNYNSGQFSSINSTTTVHQNISNGQPKINNNPLIPKV